MLLSIYRACIDRWGVKGWNAHSWFCGRTSRGENPNQDRFGWGLYAIYWAKKVPVYSGNFEANKLRSLTSFEPSDHKLAGGVVHVNHIPIYPYGIVTPYLPAIHKYRSTRTKSRLTPRRMHDAILHDIIPRSSLLLLHIHPALDSISSPRPGAQHRPALASAIKCASGSIEYCHLNTSYVLFLSLLLLFFFECKRSLSWRAGVGIMLSLTGSGLSLSLSLALPSSRETKRESITPRLN